MFETVSTAVLIITGIALLAGLILSAMHHKLPGDKQSLVSEIDSLLPQTQCAQCGYPGCRPYAEAVAAGDAGINLCPPGGNATVQRLATLLGRDPEPVVKPAKGLLVARIDESACIGCTHCLDACPVDAIVGSHQLMHTIIAAECTGCELCVAPCPVDCISMEAAG